MFAFVLDVVTESAREGLMNEIQYADDLVLMAETMEELGEVSKMLGFVWSNGVKINLGKIKVIVSGSKEEVLKSKIDPCGMHLKRVMANSLLCTECGKWIHGNVQS